MHQRLCRASADDVKVSFTQDTVILVKLQVLVMALKTHEMKPKGFKVFFVRTKVQTFGGFLDKTILSDHMLDKDIDIL